MTDAIRQFRAYLNTHDRLIQEVRPQLDPATDRADEADWMPIYTLLGSAMAVMAEDPCTLSSEQLDRIRQTVCALDQFIAPHGG